METDLKGNCYCIVSSGHPKTVSVATDEELQDWIIYKPERVGRNLRDDDNQSECSECGTLVVDMAYFDKLGGSMVMVRNYPDYCPKCGARLEETDAD